MIIFKNNSGFTLLELLIAISILGVIVAITMPKLVDYRKEQSLKNTAENIVSILNKAKSDSLNSLNSLNYGIHFSSNYLDYFIGTTYNPADINNKRTNFGDGVTLSPGGLNLNGGGSDIIFPRLIDDIIGYGSITIEITTNPSMNKTITVNKIGSISSN